MKKRIYSLVLKVKEENQNQREFQFNNTMIHALGSGLSVLYDEVFIWKIKNRLGVWVRGENEDLLVSALVHHKERFSSARLLSDQHAVEYFFDIAKGLEWREINAINKLEGIYIGMSLSADLGSLGDALGPMVSRTLGILKNHPAIYGAQYSWEHHKEKESLSLTKTKVRVTSKELFYRFSIN